MKKYSIILTVVALVIASFIAGQYFKSKEKPAVPEIHFKAVPHVPDSTYKTPKF